MGQTKVAQSLDRVLKVKTLLTKIRGYGWYCTNCKEHKDISKVEVVKILKDNHISIICLDCSTELVDCFIMKERGISDHYQHKLDCEQCSDKFRCFTRAEAVAEKPMTSRHSHEVKTSPLVKEMAKHIEGVRSYTGIYNDKLESNKYCISPDRDDCNFSWMRANYTGSVYKRCAYMKYDIKEKKWYCLHGRELRRK